MTIRQVKLGYHVYAMPDGAKALIARLEKALLHTYRTEVAQLSWANECGA